MNQHDLGRFRTESLESAAKRYKTLGFSIIPLLGARNPQQPKLPAIKWSRFQHTHPTDHDLSEWFAGKEDLGIGIVCGRVSQLLVLDIDDASVVSEFRHLHPDLANTYTVKSGTRGLPHFYFRLPVGLVVPTAAYGGADLRGEGSYVVAPPTRVGNVRWEVESNAAIRLLTPLDLRLLLRFLASLKSAPAALGEGVEMSQVSEFRHLYNSDDLVGVYRLHVSKGRNHALFKAALVARDGGVARDIAIVTLAHIHAIEPGVLTESYESRYQEALRTIQSVYNRPQRQQDLSSTCGLSNAVREVLLQSECTYVGRVLDALYMADVDANAELTESAICDLVHPFRIGRRSVMSALAAKCGEKPFFVVVQSPHIPPEYANAATDTDNLNNSCEMSRGAKRVNIQRRGRPARLYRIPTANEVASLLEVQVSGGDALRPDELATPRGYRQALHERLVTRRPGSYPRAWLSRRLGVSRWTTRRYETVLGIQVQPTFMEQHLSWATASALPEDRRDAAYGVFIQTSDGKRYPALRGVALRLLKQRKIPILKHQQVNHYSPRPVSVGIPTPETAWAALLRSSGADFEPELTKQGRPSVGIPTPQSDKSFGQMAAFNTMPTVTVLDAASQSLGVGIPTPQGDLTFCLCPHCLDFHISLTAPTYCTRCDAAPAWEIVPPLIWRDAQALKAWWHARHLAHRQAERDAQRHSVNQSSKLPSSAEALISTLQAHVKGLSFANARKLVQQFGTQLVEKALGALQKRSQIRSPAGFLISLLRSEQKEVCNNKILNNYKPKPQTESALEWLRRLAQSEYLSFIANAEDILRMPAEGEVAVLPA